MINFHVDLLQFPIFQQLLHKCVTTLHGRLDLPDAQPIYRAFPKMPLVSISSSQRWPMPSGLNWLATIHHGLPATLYPFNGEGGDYLLFLGRIAPEKRPDRAIEIARRAGVPLKIAAKIDPVDERYFHEVIEPMLDDPLIEFIGEVGDAEKAELLGHAMALLFPIDWPEPFGLVMIEAMSTGTPVVAWKRGSVPEVVETASRVFWSIPSMKQFGQLSALENSIELRFARALKSDLQSSAWRVITSRHMISFYLTLSVPED